MVLGEAMACGLPIVSADCPTGPREFLAPDTVGQTPRPLREAEQAEFGLLLPVPNDSDPSTVDIWAGELNRLLGDQQRLRHYSEKSLARAQDFTREKVGAQWLALIDDLVAPATTSP